MSPVGRRGFSVPGRRFATVPCDGDDELAADPAGDLVGLGRVRLVDDDLGDAVAVAKVEEDQLAVVATAVDPAGQAWRSCRRRDARSSPAVVVR